MNPQESGFCSLGLAPIMLEALKRLKFKTPTPIQHQTIPVALTGKDIMGVAQTGTGKTMAFAIPTVQRLAAEGGEALILVPTRELALQVSDAFKPLLRAYKMNSAVLIGGVKMPAQLARLKQSPEIIIATPGRLNDHIYQGTIDLGKINIVILDEADRMLDMGFEPQVKEIMRCVPPEKQVLLFSATMPGNILKLATQYMDLPITIEIAPQGTTTKDVSQELFVVKENAKKDVLHKLLDKYQGTVLVFTRTKIKASRIARDIRNWGFKVNEIHSNRTMSQRNSAIDGFKRGRYRVLVATDIAARGIDVSMIELVINYDLPDDAENYVHRIGRTGRAGKEGHAVTFATPGQSHDIQKIEELIKMSLPRSTAKDFKHEEFIPGAPSPRPRRRSGSRSRSSTGGNKGKTSPADNRSGKKGASGGSKRGTPSLKTPKRRAKRHKNATSKPPKFKKNS